MVMTLLTPNHALQRTGLRVLAAKLLGQRIVGETVPAASKRVNSRGGSCSLG
jgi:hypothetical protein